MAHIGRRHPKATPDDFVPGLIHHRPLYLPPSVGDLPKLPRYVVIRPDGDCITDPSTTCPPVKAYVGVGQRMVKKVEKGCFSGRRPRKDHFVDKQGAGAAISAAIENSRRISQAYASDESNQEGEQDGVPNSAKSIHVTTEEATEKGVDLVDIRRSANDAKEAAKANVRLADGKLLVNLVIKRSKGDEDGEEDTASESAQSSSSEYSLYKARWGSAALSPSVSDPDTIKRSERLRRKTASAHASPIDAVMGDLKGL